MRLISGTLCSTPLPWLPVLSNIEPPALQRKAATDKLCLVPFSSYSWIWEEEKGREERQGDGKEERERLPGHSPQISKHGCTHVWWLIVRHLEPTNLILTV